MPPNVFRINHEAEASAAPVLSEGPKRYVVDIVGVKYTKHEKEDKPTPSLRVDYALSMIDDYPVRKISEWVCLEHSGFAREKAVKWWLERVTQLEELPPTTIDDALLRLGELKNPRQIEVEKDGKWWRVLRVLEYVEGQTAGDAERERIEEEERVFLETGINF